MRSGLVLERLATGLRRLPVRRLCQSVVTPVAMVLRLGGLRRHSRDSTWDLWGQSSAWHELSGSVHVLGAFRRIGSGVAADAGNKGAVSVGSRFCDMVLGLRMLERGVGRRYGWFEVFCSLSDAVHETEQDRLLCSRSQNLLNGESCCSKRP